MTNKKRRGGRAPVGRGPIGQRPTRRQGPNLGDVTVSPQIKAFIDDGGLTIKQLTEFVFKHINGLKSAGLPNNRGATTLHEISPGEGFAVLRTLTGHMILFIDELDTLGR